MVGPAEVGLIDFAEDRLLPRLALLSCVTTAIAPAVDGLLEFSFVASGLSSLVRSLCCLLNADLRLIADDGLLSHFGLMTEDRLRIVGSMCVGEAFPPAV